MEQEILRELAYARAQFFRNAQLYRRRDQITTRFLETENAYIDALGRVRRTPVTITFPINLPANFMDAVPVIPTAQQISDELSPYVGPSQQTCSVCQDSISSDGVRLRGCQHVYHRACIQAWFGASARCPVCRRDIREGQAGQTSSDATGTPLLPTSQLEEGEIPEQRTIHHTAIYETHDEYRADIPLKFEERQNLEIDVELQLPLVGNSEVYVCVLYFS